LKQVNQREFEIKSCIGYFDYYKLKTESQPSKSLPLVIAISLQR